MTGIEALLDDTTRRTPHRTALAWSDGQMTYGQLSGKVGQVAERLGASIGRGQRVAVLAPNTPALAVGLFATWQAGGVAVPINPRSREFEVRRVFGDSGAAAVISVTTWRGYSFADLLASLQADLPNLGRVFLVDTSGTVERETGDQSARADPPAYPPPSPEIGLILYTSGTTGQPKGALYAHQAEVVGADSLAEVLGSTADDVAAFVVSICHAFGMTCFLSSIATGGTAVLVDSTFSVEPLLAALREHGATMLHGSPSVFVSLLKSGGRVPALRTGLVAGAPCPSAVLEELDEARVRVLNLYGMTELGAASCCRADDSALVRHTTVGRCLPDYQVRVVDDEVRVSGPWVTPGYYNRPELTETSFDAGWFRTGDLGSIDAQGNLSITGRVKDVVHVAGNSVFPAEVESFLLTHPDVLQAVVVGAPNPTSGEALHAFVVARPESHLTPAALLQFARARIAGYKLPYVIRVLDELPALANGKPDRVALTRSLALVER